MSDMKEKVKRIYTGLDLFVIALYYFGLPVVVYLLTMSLNHTLIAMISFYYIKWFFMT